MWRRHEIVLVFWYHLWVIILSMWHAPHLLCVPTTLQLTTIHKLVFSWWNRWSLSLLLLWSSLRFRTILAIWTSVWIALPVTSRCWCVVASKSSFASASYTCNWTQCTFLTLTDQTALILSPSRLLLNWSQRSIHLWLLLLRVSMHHGRIVTIPLTFRFDIRDLATKNLLI